MTTRLFTAVFIIGITGLFCCKAHKQVAGSGGGEQSISEKHWKLAELNGAPVTDTSYSKEPYILFTAKDSSVTGSGGCNSFRGTYQTSNNFNLKVSKLLSTRMACPKMQLEIEFLKMLETADSYYVKGDTLILNRARMAPLARFAAVK